MSEQRPAAVRTPAVAGSFYPADPDELAALVDGELARAAASGAHPRSRPKAIIAPHAGYRYSGPVAASAYQLLRDAEPPIDHVVLLGPAHRVPVFGMAVPTVDAFATPLGPVAIDADARRRVAEHPAVELDDRPHAGEHSVEVHLPFLQRALGGSWTLLPIVVGDADPRDVADVLDLCWGDDATLVVASSDLSHYLDHATATRLDRETADLIVGGRTDALVPDRACGARPIAGLLEAARRRGMGAELLDLRNSGDTSGPPDRVVGYGAFAVS